MSLKKWKKIELLDLADKLDIYVSQSSTKAKIADKIQEYLELLETPLDLQEYPELATYYESVSTSDDDDDNNKIADTIVSAKLETSEEEAENDDEEEEAENDNEDDGEAGEGKTGFAWTSSLDFSRITPAESPFAFKFHEFLQDVQERAREANENLQDALSTIPAVDAVFMAIEFYVYVVAPHVKLAPFSHAPQVVFSVGWREFASLILFWAGWSVAVPALVAYYVNFIRYDLPDMNVDPMVFHVTKALLALLVSKWQPSFANEAAYTVKDVSGNVSAADVAAHWFRFALIEWKLQLGLLPFVLAVAGCALCLYVL
ncbi:LAMI_0H07052g1_1 [Lachancea mirantina]|uniref:LAMI_0H07052g1_1 n=1 Tax=Lachancea mirantina TaxID=1230905 RepID=A0A1G4KFL9_9SACH|nr:LAMI_0H07052g1_1 [Lachancea mirantina]